MICSGSAGIRLTRSANSSCIVTLETHKPKLNRRTAGVHSMTTDTDLLFLNCDEHYFHLVISGSFRNAKAQYVHRTFQLYLAPTLSNKTDHIIT